MVVPEDPLFSSYQALVPAFSQPSGELLARELAVTLPKSDSIWGEHDVLNSRGTSESTTRRIKNLVDSLGSGGGLYVGMRALLDRERYKLPVRVFSEDPSAGGSTIEEMVTAISGPLSYTEALAVGYILESAALTKDILEGNLPLVQSKTATIFETIASQIRGGKRFLPLGWFLLHDYITRMAAYRNHLQYFEGLDLSEDSAEDMAGVVGLGCLPLAWAFRRDGYVIGNNFQDILERYYIGNKHLFVPFAGIDSHPKSVRDWKMVGAGLYTGIRLFRTIEQATKRPMLS